MERTRTDSTLGQSHPGTIRTWYYSKDGITGEQVTAGGEPTTWYSTPDTYTWTMSDVVTPGYSKRIQQGEIINNPMSLIETTLRYPRPGSYGYTNYDTDEDGIMTGSEAQGTLAFNPAKMGTFLPNPNSDWGTTITDLTSQAVTDAHANASSAEISLLMVGAEAEKSVASVASILRRVYKIMRAARKLDLKYLRKQISRKELADRYMELRYALRPLVYDAQGTIAALDQSRHFGSTRATARGFRTVSASNNDTIPGELTYSAFTIERKFQSVVNIRAGVLTDVQTSGISVWGMDQFLETVWEVIPFSFIVDWFVNVGQTIAAWTPSAGVRELASWVTVEEIITQSNRITEIHHKDESRDAHAFWWHDQEMSQVTRIKTRTVNPNLSLYPSVNVRLDPLKLLDLVIIGKKALNRPFQL